MGRKKEITIPIDIRRDNFEQLSLEYWEMYFKYRSMASDADHYGIVKVKKSLGNLNKRRKEAARGDFLPQNNLSLSEMKIIDEGIKSRLRD